MNTKATSNQTIVGSHFIHDCRIISSFRVSVQPGVPETLHGSDAECDNPGQILCNAEYVTDMRHYVCYVVRVVPELSACSPSPNEFLQNFHLFKVIKKNTLHGKHFNVIIYNES